MNAGFEAVSGEVGGLEGWRVGAMEGWRDGETKGRRDRDMGRREISAMYLLNKRIIFRCRLLVHNKPLQGFGVTR